MACLHCGREASIRLGWSEVETLVDTVTVRGGIPLPNNLRIAGDPGLAAWLAWAAPWNCENGKCIENRMQHQ